MDMDLKFFEFIFGEFFGVEKKVYNLIGIFILRVFIIKVLGSGLLFLQVVFVGELQFILIESFVLCFIQIVVSWIEILVVGRVIVIKVIDIRIIEFIVIFVINY